MYQESHENFTNEVHQAVGSYVLWKELQNQPSDDAELLNKFNETPLSWIFFRHSLMVSLIMALGRIFDTDGDSLSVHHFIRSCIDDISVFSKESVISRNPNKKLEQVYEIVESDFRKLKSEISKYRELFQKYYQPLRHKIFAHSSKEMYQLRDELWHETKNANIEEILNFLTDLDISIRQAYLNGHEVKLMGRKMDEQYYSKDIQTLFEKLKNS